ncbi:plasmid replication initiation protein [Weissella fangxianensis]|uniref:plasmid replication initiation protein n=1 Tax=Weissella fangxianensis TaxID=2953879 RepID=UPI002157E3E0|nr:plasmid replication initiation protein [Weissella fangxianensis]
MNTSVIKRRLYLADLEVTATDVYIKSDFSNKTSETLDMSRTANSAVNQEEYNNLDTNRYYKETAQLDFSTANFSNAQIEKQNQEIVANASEFLVSNGNSGKIILEAETINEKPFN